MAREKVCDLRRIDSWRKIQGTTSAVSESSYLKFSRLKLGDAITRRRSLYIVGHVSAGLSLKKLTSD
jgi:hypothetical protein